MGEHASKIEQWVEKSPIPMDIYALNFWILMIFTVAEVAAVLRPDEGGVEPQHRGEVRRTEVRRRGREPVRKEATGEHGGLAWGDAILSLD